MIAPQITNATTKATISLERREAQERPSSMMDPNELAKVPPGLPRWRWMACHHPIEFGVWMLTVAAMIFAFVVIW